MSMPCVEHEAGDAGDLVAGAERVLDRGGAPPAGQQREVEVDEAPAADVEDPLRQQGAVGDDGAGVDVERGQVVERSRGLDRLPDGEAVAPARRPSPAAGPGCLERPFGRSGLVRTATTSTSSAATSASSAGRPRRACRGRRCARQRLPGRSGRRTRSAPAAWVSAAVDRAAGRRRRGRTVVALLGRRTRACAFSASCGRAWRGGR